jgi:hypothetical protein
LKTWPKQLLGSLPLDIEAPRVRTNPLTIKKIRGHALAYFVLESGTKKKRFITLTPERCPWTEVGSELAGGMLSISRYRFRSSSSEERRPAASGASGTRTLLASCRGRHLAARGRWRTSPSRFEAQI